MLKLTILVDEKVGEEEEERMKGQENHDHLFVLDDVHFDKCDGSVGIIRL